MGEVLLPALRLETLIELSKLTIWWGGEPTQSESNHDESVEEANHLARKACDNDPRLTYLDINSLFMYSDGTQRVRASEESMRRGD